MKTTKDDAMSSPENSDVRACRFTDPILKIEEEQVHLMALCDRLETIADRLPDNLNHFTVETVAYELRAKLPRLHMHMEQQLFPILKKRALPEDGIEEIIDGFTHEHAMDDGYVLGVLGVLEILDQSSRSQIAADQTAENYEAVGYLLRGFFEALRRHLRWQRFIVLRLARLRLSDKDLVEINDQISIKPPDQRPDEC